MDDDLAIRAALLAIADEDLIDLRPVGVRTPVEMSARAMAAAFLVGVEVLLVFSVMALAALVHHPDGPQVVLMAACLALLAFTVAGFVLANAEVVEQGQ